MANLRALAQRPSWLWVSMQADGLHATRRATDVPNYKMRCVRKATPMEPTESYVKPRTGHEHVNLSRVSWTEKLYCAHAARGGAASGGFVLSWGGRRVSLHWRVRTRG